MTQTTEPTATEPTATDSRPHPLDTLRGTTMSGTELLDTYGMDIDGDSWSVASDGFRVLMCKGLRDGVTPNSVPEILAATINDLLAGDLAYCCFATPAQLLAFGGPISQCPKCKTSCKNCGPQGYLNIQYQGVAFNWDWVRDILGGLEADQVRVSLNKRALRIDCRDWAYFQMCVFISPDKLAEYPDLAAYLAG